MRAATATRRIVCVGVSWWNRPTLAALLAEDGVQVSFVETLSQGLCAARDTGADLAVWASRLQEGDRARIEAEGVSIAAVEDGFLRSVGLGAGLAQGGAYVIDRQGIYYDATRPSDIETLLEEGDIGDGERARARALISAIITARVSKYNVGRRFTMPLTYPAGRERILVVGQVAADAGVHRTLSATLDVSDAATINRDLLRAARDEFPKAHIVYKPHPDVATGLRPGTVPEQDLARLADAVVAHADIVDLIAETDRLVTLSSLSGFEALLRGKPVTVHGMPFYAGWGLTDDHTTTPRRTRRRDLESLAAAALIRYCRYVDPVHRRPTTPEAMVAALARQRGDPVHRFKTGVRRQLSWAGRKLGL